MALKLTKPSKAKYIADFMDKYDIKTVTYSKNSRDQDRTKHDMTMTNTMD